MIIKTDNFQRAFFGRLQLRFDSKKEMIEAISKLLHVGRDGVYRRIRGETVLAADEMITLARHYSIKIETRSKEQMPKMYFPNGAKKFTSELEWFEELLQRTKMNAALPDVKVDYATPELPLFYQLYAPTLLAYKTYIFGTTAWDLSKWKGAEFSPDMIDPGVQKIAEELMPVLYSFPARELWSAGILDVTLREIIHGVEVGNLPNSSVVDKMFDEIEAIIQHMEAMTKAGKRFAPNEVYTEKSPDFRVYHNEMTNTNNVILVHSSLQSIVYTTFVNPNYLFSTDERLYARTQTWFINLVSTSNTLNNDAAKYRIAYFKHLRKKVDDAKRRIEGINTII